MKLPANSINATSLAELGAEAVRLLAANDFDTLAGRLGYALAFDRLPAAAIRTDFEHCLAQAGTDARLETSAAKVSVKFFGRNDAKLFGVVECFVPLSGRDSRILVELIVSSNGNERHACLEQISYAANPFAQSA